MHFKPGDAFSIGSKDTNMARLLYQDHNSGNNIALHHQMFLCDTSYLKINNNASQTELHPPTV